MALKLWGLSDRTPLPDLIPGGMRKAEKEARASCVVGALPGADCITPVIWSHPCGVYLSHSAGGMLRLGGFSYVFMVIVPLSSRVRIGLQVDPRPNSEITLQSCCAFLVSDACQGLELWRWGLTGRVCTARMEGSW